MSSRDRDRDRDRDKDRKRVRDDRDRDRDRKDRIKRSHTPEQHRSRHTRSPDRYSRRHHHTRSPSPSPSRKRHKIQDIDNEDNKDHRQKVSDFVDGIVKDQKKKSIGDDVDEGLDAVDSDEIEMMKKFGIPVGFDSTKGKPVTGNDVSGVRAVTKRQPRQYMNRRGGFNRPLPAERNR